MRRQKKMGNEFDMWNADDVNIRDYYRNDVPHKRNNGFRSNRFQQHNYPELNLKSSAFHVPPSVIV